jgi:hypothetical protein
VQHLNLSLSYERWEDEKDEEDEEDERNERCIIERGE